MSCTVAKSTVTSLAAPPVRVSMIVAVAVAVNGSVMGYTSWLNWMTPGTSSSTIVSFAVSRGPSARPFCGFTSRSTTSRSPSSTVLGLRIGIVTVWVNTPAPNVTGFGVGAPRRLDTGSMTISTVTLLAAPPLRCRMMLAAAIPSSTR